MDRSEVGEEMPHARGPEEVGMSDMGPQHHTAGLGGGLNMEAAVGRARSPLPEVAAVRAEESGGVEEAVAPEISGGEVEAENADIEMGDGDQEVAGEAGEPDADVVVADADGREVEK